MTKIVRRIMFVIFAALSLVSAGFLIAGIIDAHQLGDYSTYTIIRLASHAIVSLLWAIFAVLHFGGKNGSDT